MISKPLVAGLLAAGCVTAAAGGAYVAVRQNSDDRVVATEGAPAPPSGATQVPPTVAETEAVVAPASTAGPDTGPNAPILERPDPAPPRPAAPAASAPRPAAREGRRSQAPAGERAETRRPPPDASRTPPAEQPAAAAADLAAPIPTARPETIPPTVPTMLELPPAPPAREYIEVVVPAASVVGLQVETAISSERARVEDRVNARVTRDVSAGGRVAIPAGSRVIGSVILVERGGKIKERARLGVRFHTLVFADGTELPIRTEAIYREGESPSGESARKIGGAAVGGAILGAILGGGKGAVLGGAAGAAGGTAATMAGDRNAASLPSGTIVTVRFAEPVTLDVEKRDPQL